VIYDGEMVDGIGGGVCQVASTLHAAALLGGLNIVRHAPHSRPQGDIVERITHRGPLTDAPLEHGDSVESLAVEPVVTPNI